MSGIKFQTFDKHDGLLIVSEHDGWSSQDLAGPVYCFSISEPRKAALMTILTRDEAKQLHRALGTALEESEGK
jgi:hypothetical protein